MIKRSKHIFNPFFCNYKMCLKPLNQIFFDRTYPNGETFTKWTQYKTHHHKNTNWPSNLAKISTPRLSKIYIYQNWEFWYENIPSGNPALKLLGWNNGEDVENVSFVTLPMTIAPVRKLLNINGPPESPLQDPCVPISTPAHRRCVWKRSCNIKMLV
jgi:hypothetical protein